MSVQEIFKKNELKIITPSFEKKNYKTFSINNRRYLGNKYKLNDFIKSVITQECGEFDTFADIFAGTGAVSAMFSDKKLIINDILFSNYVSYQTWFGNDEFSQEKILQYLEKYNNISVTNNNYMSINYSNTYFSENVCKKIGYIREDIEKSFKKKNINYREKCILITSLLYAMDKIANTCGHYDAYRKNGELTNNLELALPAIKTNGKINEIYNIDSNKLAKFIKADVVYIDPPYNSRQYCDAYHLLENVATWEKPKVKGIAKKMDRTSLKSDYCTKNATNVFENLVNNIKAKYIVLSYNNMANKGNDRSNAKMSDDEIIRILKTQGEVKIFEQDFKAFSTGKSDIEENKERLFVCKCYKSKQEFIQSPLNYTGGKYKLLSQILPYFPKQIDTFVDLFCGGGNVGINIKANKIIFNDINSNLIYLFNTFKNLDEDIIFEMINRIVSKYNLSNSFKNGYKYYDCDSSKGLGKYNKEKFLKLRQDFNNIKNQDYYYFILFYVLIIYSFNNQIRFNSNGLFNLPVGKRDFNKQMQAKLLAFITTLKEKKTVFENIDFRNFDISQLNKDSLVYIDPPYLITCATYNEQNGWDEQDEKDLLNFLDNLHYKNIKFALSNVLKNKNKENSILISWLEKNKSKYKAINLDYSYSNSNYQIKDKTTNTEEVLVVNYEVN
ncbi:MAG: Dam family site-specific DNA-(adenine-N6)-methyltransferase [bacterium]